MSRTLFNPAAAAKQRQQQQQQQQQPEIQEYDDPFAPFLNNNGNGNDKPTKHEEIDLDNNTNNKLEDFSYLYENKDKERGVLRLPPLPDKDGYVAPTIFVQGSNGESRWVTFSDASCRFKDDEDDDDDAEKTVDETARSARRTIDGRQSDILLRTSLQSAAEIERQAEEQKQRQKELANLLGRGDNSNKNQQQQQTTSSAVAGEQLWVTRYAATRFSELLSDERINLEVLQWMTQWKKHVTSGNEATSNSHKSGTSKSSKAAAAATRPDPIVLIAGPPGVGKTTLAHVIARHCGFDAIEVNASYSRSAAEMKNLIEAATADTGIVVSAAAAAASGVHDAPNNNKNSGTNNSTTTATNTGNSSKNLSAALLRPKCLILDEVDGSTTNVIKLLLSTPLHRPVLCLANNLYAPVLRELRTKVTFVRSIPPLQPQRIVSRLEAIADMEGLNIDRHSLMDLSLHCAGDIRQCLNTLFFVSRQVPAVQQQQQGQQGQQASSTTSTTSASRLLKMLRVREPTVSMWSMWECTLERREKSKYIQSLTNAGVITKEEAANATNMALVMPTKEQQQQQQNQQPQFNLNKFDAGSRWVAHCASKCPELETVLGGLHEWYCQLQYPDYSFTSTATVTDAFAWFDRADPFTGQFNAICEAVAVTVFRACATLSPRPPALRNVVPRETQHYAAELQRSQEIISSFIERLNPNVAGNILKVFCGPTAAAQDLLPFFVKMVSLIPAGLKLAPGVTSLSSVRNVKDAEALHRLVELLAAFGISFEHDSTAAAANTNRKDFIKKKYGVDAAARARDGVEWRMTPVDLEEWAEWKKSSDAISKQTRSSGGAGNNQYQYNKAGAAAAAAPPPEAGVMRAAAGLNTSVASLFNTRTVWDVTMRPIPNDVRELLVGEVTKMRNMRRPREDEAVAVPQQAQNAAAAAVAAAPVVPPNSADASKHKTTVPSPAKQSSSSLFAKPATTSTAAPPIARDFFGRPIVKKEQTSAQMVKAAELQKQKDDQVKYRFFDGATNSVRKPATSADFL